MSERRRSPARPYSLPPTIQPAAAIGMNTQRLAILIVGDTETAETAKSLLEDDTDPDMRVLTCAGIEDGLALLSSDTSIALVLLLWQGDNPEQLPDLVQSILARQSNPMMAVMVRSRTKLPEHVSATLWHLGVADRNFFPSHRIHRTGRFGGAAMRNCRRQITLTEFQLYPEYFPAPKPCAIWRSCRCLPCMSSGSPRAADCSAISATPPNASRCLSPGQVATKITAVFPWTDRGSIGERHDPDRPGSMPQSVLRERRGDLSAYSWRIHGLHLLHARFAAAALDDRGAAYDFQHDRHRYRPTPSWRSSCCAPSMPPSPACRRWPSTAMWIPASTLLALPA